MTTLATSPPVQGPAGDSGAGLAPNQPGVRDHLLSEGVKTRVTRQRGQSQQQPQGYVGEVLGRLPSPYPAGPGIAQSTRDHTSAQMSHTCSGAAALNMRSPAGGQPPAPRRASRSQPAATASVCRKSSGQGRPARCEL